MKRIVAIDLLRGFALLGILLMNSVSFAMPTIAYFNPTSFGGESRVNQATYIFLHIFADQKFMALFSMLFGASVMLLINSLQRKGQKPTAFFYQRNFWLLIFGLIHAIFIWEGDILIVYALCSFLLYLFRNWSPRWQFTLGLIIFLLPAAGYFVGDSLISDLSAANLAPLTAYWNPSDAEFSAEIDLYRGSYSSQVEYRMGEGGVPVPALDIYLTSFIFEIFTRAMGMMLMGMAFYTWSILTAKKSDQFYKRLLGLGLPLGSILAALGVWWNYSAEWAAQHSMFIGRIPNLLATPLIASSYIALIMLWSRSQLWQNLQERLVATGRTALTNYIGQSIIGTFIFYGFGLGLFGSLSRLQILPVVILIWAIQLWASPLWLNRFRYGPLEWLWRSLSYRKWQPLAKQTAPTPSQP